MFKLFKEKEVSNYLPKFEIEQEILEVKDVAEEQYEIIDSKHIQKDIDKTFEEVLKENVIQDEESTEIQKLLDKLEDFKKENEKVYNKIQSLEKLGLTSTPSVIKLKKELQEKESKLNQKIMSVRTEIKNKERFNNWVAKYKVVYPMCKFVDEATMTGIMHKYDLYMGDSCFYNKEIPEDSLEIISQYAEEIEESKKELYIEKITSSGWARSRWENICVNKRDIKKETTSFSGVSGYPIADYNTSFRNETLKSFIVSKFKMVAPENHFTKECLIEVLDKNNNYKMVNVLEFNEDTRQITINDKEVQEIMKERREVLDPIACLKVDGGYIVMDSWDKEADIPEIKHSV